MLIAPTSDPQFAIERSDGAFYVGTVDWHPIFTDDRRSAGTFDSKRAAGRRARGLHRGESKGRTFKVIPIEADGGTL